MEKQFIYKWILPEDDPTSLLAECDRCCLVVGVGLAVGADVCPGNGLKMEPLNLEEYDV